MQARLIRRILSSLSPGGNRRSASAQKNTTGGRSRSTVERGTKGNRCRVGVAADGPSARRGSTPPPPRHATALRSCARAHKFSWPNRSAELIRPVWPLLFRVRARINPLRCRRVARPDRPAWVVDTGDDAVRSSSHVGNVPNPTCICLPILLFLRGLEAKIPILTSLGDLGSDSLRYCTVPLPRYE